MNWFVLSLIGALFNGFQIVFNKVALRSGKFECLVGAINFLLAGLVCGVIYLMFSRFSLSLGQLTAGFWLLVLAHVLLEVTAVWCLLRAFSLAELSFLGPFLPAINIGVLLQAWVMLGEMPSASGLSGSVIILAAIIWLSVKTSGRPDPQNRQNIYALRYFTVTFICWTFTPVIRKMAMKKIFWLTDEMMIVLFFGAVLCLVIGLAFIPLALAFREQKRYIIWQYRTEGI